MLYIEKLVLIKSRIEWMKGICQMWSRGRHFSPSTPGDRYLKLSSQKRSPGRNLGEHRLLRCSGTTVLIFCKRMRGCFTTEGLTFLSWEKVLGYVMNQIAEVDIGITRASSWAVIWRLLSLLFFFKAVLLTPFLFLKQNQVYNYRHKGEPFYHKLMITIREQSHSLLYLYVSRIGVIINRFCALASGDTLSVKAP